MAWSRARDASRATSRVRPRFSPTWVAALGIAGLVAAARPSESPGCPASATGPSRREALRLSRAAWTRVRSGPAIPYGGSDSARWRPEAVLANAVWRELSERGADPSVEEIVVSVPVRMIFTGERVYGDGQTNATLSFGDGWTARTPQLVATLAKRAGGAREIALRFAPSLEIPSASAEAIHYVESTSPAGTRRIEKRVDRVPLLARPDGTRVGTWRPPAALAFGDLARSRVAWIRPVGWDSAFPIDFRAPVKPVADLSAAAGAARTVGRAPLDPLGIRGVARSAQELPQSVLLRQALDSRWVANQSGGHALRNEDIHGRVPSASGPVPTAVGGGHTWLVERGPHSAFKNLYTCFDARDVEAEARAGVPSGGGWHEIGDAAETIINVLEDAAIPVGFAAGAPAAPPDGLRAPWDLTDVASVRLLAPGEALVTGAGDRTWAEDASWRAKVDGGQRGKSPERDGRSYHWFFFPFDVPVCTQEWVHPCRPEGDERLGLSC